jgi:RNA polymerase sigma-70 factor (ECF subfamily)
MKAAGPGRRALPPDDPDPVFERERPRLLRLAYQMLGTLGDAEDVLQDAWLRWTAADRAAVAEPQAYLTRIVGRLCLDQLRSARARREVYVGPWLPEPVVEHPALSPQAGVEAAHDVSVGLMLAMERLSPLERAAFLLHDVFEVEFAEIGAILERTAAACRQLALRARAHIDAGRRRFPLTREAGERIARAFGEAVAAGDAAALGRLLAADASLTADGGGKRTAILNTLQGRTRIARFFAGGARKGWFATDFEVRWINGQPGYVTREADGLPQVTILEIAGGRVAAVYIMRNPDKLRGVAADRDGSAGAP